MEESDIMVTPRREDEGEGGREIERERPRDRESEGERERLGGWMDGFDSMERMEGWGKAWEGKRLAGYWLTYYLTGWLAGGFPSHSHPNFIRAISSRGDESLPNGLPPQKCYYTTYY